MSASRQCSDNDGDRAIGEYWERQFCRMAATAGKVFSPHQINNPSKSAAAYGPPGADGRISRYLLPDVTVWSAPGEHHEVKHKSQTWDGCYGLEWYRLEALARWASTTGQATYYTIHDWQLAGAEDSSERTRNDMAHWYCADVTELIQGCTKPDPCGTSWIRGTIRHNVLIWYWTAYRYFRPLTEVWQPVVAA